MDYYLVIWLALLIILGIIEFATLGLTTVWFCAGAVVAIIANICGAPLIVQIVLFLIISIVTLIFTRPLVIRYINKDRIKTNADSLIGKSAIVVEEIDNLKAMGTVNINGQEWTARCEDENGNIEAGEVVEIKAIQGVKLIVAKQ